MGKIKRTMLLLGGLFIGVYAMSAQEVLNRLRNTTTAQDRRVKAVMRITDKSKRVQERTLRMVMKGDKKMLVTFISPAELRGVSFLTTAPENMWVYLPAQGRVRRISGSAADQSFGGSDFSYKEMASISFGTSVAHGEADEVELNGVKAYLITLEQDGEESRLWVEKERFLPLRLEKIARDGRVAKSIVFADFQKANEVWIPRTVRLDNLARGTITELKLLDVEIDVGIKDSYFTEENMKKGA